MESEGTVGQPQAGRTLPALRLGVSVDRLMEALYARHRRNYVRILLGFAVAWLMVVMTPLNTALLYPYFDATTEQVLQIMLGFEIALVIAAPGIFFIGIRSLRPADAWLRGEKTASAAAAWSSTLPSYAPMIVRIAAWVALCFIPPALYAGDLVGLSAAGELLYLLMLAIIIAGGAVFAYLFFELALRPPFREIAAEFGVEELERYSARGVQLSTKIIVLVPLITLYTGVIVAAVSTNSLGLEGNMAVTLGAAVLVSATVALGLTVVLRSSLLNRLEELRAAIGQVVDGNYTVRVGPSGGDEIDDVGRSFNQMARRLGEHENEMRESRARIVVAADDARRHVERDLHDGAQQHLVLLRMKLGMVGRALEADPAKANELLNDARGSLDEALEELRNLAHGIYPALLENDGLPAALAEAGQRATIATEVSADGTGRYPPEIEAAVYFCCLEALQNASKHAGESARATVSLAQRNGMLEFAVRDDGKGYDTAAVGASAGLQNMADRIGALGGSLDIRSAPGSGTTVEGSVPAKAS